jgi:hypothetical protein
MHLQDLGITVGLAHVVALDDESITHVRSHGHAPFGWWTADSLRQWCVDW